MKKAIYIGAIILLLVIFGVSAFMVGDYFLESKKQADKFNSLSEMKDEAKNNAANEATAETSPEGTFGAEVIRNEDGMLIEYADIYEMNNDLVGWIKMDGTKIDYPVMHTPDSRDYYLKRDFDGEHSERGCIYIREECDMLEPSDNITIYGHNMLDGSMFAALNAYTERETWENNSLIFFDTLYDYHVYKIFAVFKTTASVGEGFSYHQFVDAEDEEEFNDYVATCKNLAFYDTGITPVYGDKLIALSTCEYTLENGRLVVCAYRIA